MLEAHKKAACPTRPVLLVVLAIGGAALLSGDVLGSSRANRTGDACRVRHEVTSSNATVGKRTGKCFSGVLVADLDAKQRTDLRIPVGLHGVFVTSVDPSSLAYKAGFRSGQVILQIDDHPVMDAQEALADAARQMGYDALVKVWSRREVRYIIVPNSSPA
jgi:S1-C subfamily serine protease